jgi:hypothetical protein
MYHEPSGASGSPSTTSELESFGSVRDRGAEKSGGNVLSAGTRHNGIPGSLALDAIEAARETLFDPRRFQGIGRFRDLDHDWGQPPTSD